ncbi:E3 ubiquitin-protein ligase MARCH3-like [Copidosoma floridanum]|uniref:E3 ubiquitin-protein ligase MARCH3-like n=1 Tax=Copidosoma floridanum TaxID=29053 RepID=UPI0006C9AB72|nr:E3 ubiquitin-protein ligase MARCH3-like [Copidosoma floridanum]XP_023246166.1 E3 ubiquitin-protein ligase MARCH3-like [Copidosoma floridanum]
MPGEQAQKNNTGTATGVCRICYEDAASEELIEPCECSGTLGLIHASCLEKWLSTWNTDRCEICKYTFAVERRTKSPRQSVKQWWWTRGLYGPQGVTGDAVCLIVLTPLCLAATYLCGVGASAYARLDSWEGTGLAILCCMLVITYFLWLFVTMRFHYKSWKQWCRRNQEVKLLAKCKLSDEDRKKALNRQQRGGERPASTSELDRLCGWFDFSFSRRPEPIFNFHQQTTFV